MFFKFYNILLIFFGTNQPKTNLPTHTRGPLRSFRVLEIQLLNQQKMFVVGNYVFVHCPCTELGVFCNRYNKHYTEFEVHIYKQDKLQ